MTAKRSRKFGRAMQNRPAFTLTAVDAPEEERERIARDPESGYEGLDLSVTIESTQVEEDDDNE